MGGGEADVFDLPELRAGVRLAEALSSKGGARMLRATIRLADSKSAETQETGKRLAPAGTRPSSASRRHERRDGPYVVVSPLDGEGADAARQSIPAVAARALKSSSAKRLR